MTDPTSELERLRQQFDTAPFPRIPLERSPRNDRDALFAHSLITPYYLRYQQVTDPTDQLILDVGCGTGYTSLMLAEANPGARIIGIDLSANSIDLAIQRLAYYGFKNVEFQVLAIEELPKLNLEFDYINCDEVLYLIPDPLQGLQAMKAVLKPEGIIRTNLHSLAQRFYLYQGQKLCEFMGFMEGGIEEWQVETVRELFRSLKPQVKLKSETWTAAMEQEDDRIRANHMLQGDKGFSIPETFALLQQADLEFISMVQWRRWELLDLFQDPANLPSYISMSLPELTLEQRLYFYELLNPVNRSIDFWCGHPQPPCERLSVPQWEESHWKQSTAQLHPQLKTDQARQDLIQCIRGAQPFTLNRHLTIGSTSMISFESSVATCLLPLWDGPQPVMALVERWLKTYPLDPITLEPRDPKVALQTVKQVLGTLETFLYVLLECPC